MLVGKLFVCVFVGAAVANASINDASAGVFQQQGKKILGELSTAEGMIKKELSGHPKIVQEEMQFLKKAEDAAQTMRSGSFVELQKAENKEGQKAVTETREQVHASLEQMEQQRNKEMASDLQAERRFGKAERDLSKDGEKIISDFGTAEDAVAQAFAGKDSKAVKTAMQVGELLEEARDHQREVTKMNANWAEKSEKKASELQAALAKTSLAQTSAESKTEQEEHAYATGMASLAKDDKAQLAKFADAKAAIAKAFAGKDSKAVETAMEAGEMLDKARNAQAEVAKLDAKEAADAPGLFRLFDKANQVMSHPAKTGFLQSKVQSSSATEASLQSKLKSMEEGQVSRLVSLGQHESGILQKTEFAEDAITKDLAKDGSKAAMATEHEVIAMMEQAKQAEEAAHTATKKALAEAKSRQGALQSQVRSATEAKVALHSQVKSSASSAASLQNEMKSMAAMRLSHLVTLGDSESKILHNTERAEDAITKELAKEGSQAAMSTEHEVIAMMEKAKHMEEGSYKATQEAVREAQAHK